MKINKIKQKLIIILYSIYGMNFYNTYTYRIRLMLMRFANVYVQIYTFVLDDFYKFDVEIYKFDVEIYK